jgi:hypothetical protein
MPVGWPFIGITRCAWEVKEATPWHCHGNPSGGRTNLEGPMAERPELIGLAPEIISGHVSNNAIAAEQLPGLIQKA